MNKKPSIRIIFLLILNVLIISGCVAPKSKENRLIASADACLRKGQLLKEALQCLSKKGIKPLSINKAGINYHSCGPYWGYPFMASCAGLRINLNPKGTIEDWHAWGTLDGL